MGASREQLIQFDWSGAQLKHTGLRPEALRDFAEPLKQARVEVLERDLPLTDSPELVPADRRSCDVGFIDLPDRILRQYERLRAESALGQILTTAKRLREAVDRVVVLGRGGSHLGAQAVMRACCHPYHNELSRAERGGVPRLYFVGPNLDNDAQQGLLNLLGAATPATSDNTLAVDREWAIVVINRSDETLETAVSLQILLDGMRRHCDGSNAELAKRVIPVTGGKGTLRDLARALGCADIFNVPDGFSGQFSILSPEGLVPAALLGLDVVQLLRGAVEMTEHFRSAPVGNNRVLDFVGVGHLMEVERAANIRVFAVWSQAMEAVSFWYESLLMECLGKPGARPLTVVNTRDLHSRTQQYLEESRNKLFTNVILRSWRQDALAVGQSAVDRGGPTEIADRTLPQILTAALDATKCSLIDAGHPTTDLTLPSSNERYLGQLFQMLMLATVVEGRLMGVDPYG